MIKRMSNHTNNLYELPVKGFKWVKQKNYQHLMKTL